MNPAAAIADVHHVGVYRLRFLTSAAAFPGKSAKLVRYGLLLGYVFRRRFNENCRS